MYILSVDVGLKNLAFCLMSTEENGNLEKYGIHYWNVINTLDSSDDNNRFCVNCKRTANMKCQINQMILDCDNNPIEESILNYYCKTHYPKDKPIKKENKITNKKVKDFLLQDIAKLVITTLETIWRDIDSNLDHLTKIVIELQPRVNNKMKFVSHVVYGKIIDLLSKHEKDNVIVRFVAATKKLRVYTGPYVACKLKGDYAKRKYLSIKYTEWFLKEKFTNVETWLELFLKHYKKDDLADCFLMCLNELK